MLRFQSASVVSSIGAEEAMPAFETRMSTPPNSTPRRRIGARHRRLVGHVHLDARAPRPCRAAPRSSRPSRRARRRRCRRAPRRRPRAGALGRRRADAAGAAGDQRDPAGQALRLRHALQLRLLEQPVLDVEGLLLGQAAVLGDRRGAAHHVDGVDVELAGDPRRRLVLGEGDHADAGHQVDHRRSGRASPGCRALAALVVGGVVGAVGFSTAAGEPGERRVDGRALPDRSRRPAAGSWCAGSGRGRTCRARPAAACPAR